MSILQRLAPNKQRGLMSSWPRGRGIEELCGHLAAIILIVGVSGLALGWVWPDLGRQTLTDLLVRALGAAGLGAVWLALRLDKLGAARLALIGTGTVFGGLVALGTLIMARDDRLVADQPWLFFVLLVALGILWLFWWAQKEVGRELARRSGSA